jgi:multidrug resistance efflux pump
MLTKLVVLFALFTLGLTACANQPTVGAEDITPAPVSSNDIVAEGNLEPVRAAHLVFQMPGTVEEVHVRVGDRVSEGDVLARLGNAEQADAGLAAARLELVQAQQALDTLNRTGSSNLAAAWSTYMEAQETRAEAEREWEDLNVDNIDERIDDAAADLEDLGADLQDAREEFDKYKDLDEDNSSRTRAEDDLEAAQEDYNEALRSLEEIRRERDTVRAALDAALAVEAEARHQYELSSEGVNADQLTLSQARLENAEAQVAAAEDALANYTLTAPFDGVVAGVEVQAGEQVSPELRALSIADTSTWVVETTDVTELEVVDLQVGQRATLVPDALPAVIMDGVITEISQASTIQGGDVLYTVRIQTDDVDPRLKWGMTVEVTFNASGDD